MSAHRPRSARSGSPTPSARSPIQWPGDTEGARVAHLLDIHGAQWRFGTAFPGHPTVDVLDVWTEPAPKGGRRTMEQWQTIPATVSATLAWLGY